MRFVVVIITLFVLSESVLLKRPTDRKNRSICSDPHRCPSIPDSSFNSSSSSSNSSSNSNTSDGSSEDTDSENETISTTSSSEDSNTSSENSSSECCSTGECSCEEYEDETDSSTSSSEKETDAEVELDEHQREDHGMGRNKRQSDDDLDGVDMDENIEVNLLMDFEDLEMSLKNQLVQHFSRHPGAFNRERIQIVDTVMREFKFPTDQPIKKWISTDGKVLGVGHFTITFLNITDTDISVEYKEMLVDDADLFRWWDEEEQTLQTILLVAQDATIDWYIVTGENDLVQIWAWTLVDSVEHVKIFKTGDELKLLVVSESLQNHYNGQRKTTIYGMDFLQDWWMEQRIFGDYKPSVSRDGEYIVTYSNSLQTVFVYQLYDQYHRYVLHHNVSVSTPVSDVSTFHIAYTPFIAIANGDSTIYQIKDHHLVPCSIDNFHLNEVDYWLPVIVDYLRDDSIVLFQKKLDHFTHSTTIIEALTWNGDSFKVLEHAPCYSNGQLTYGFLCLAKETPNQGLLGATALNWEDGNFYIVGEMIFNIHSEIVEVPNPVYEDTEYIFKTVKNIQHNYKKQEDEIEKLEMILRSAPSYIAKHWHIKELRALSLHLRGSAYDYLINDDSFRINNVPQGRQNEKMIEDYKDILQDHKNRIDNAILQLKNAINKDDKDINLNIQGRLKVNGDVFVKEAKIETINNNKVNNVLMNLTDYRLLSNSNVTEIESLDVDEVIVEGYFNKVKLPKKNMIDPIYFEGDLVLNNPITILNNIKINPGGYLNNLDLISDVISSSDRNTTDYNDNTLINFKNIKVSKMLEVAHTVNGEYIHNQEVGHKLQTNYKRASKTNDEILKLNSLSAVNVKVDSVNGVPWDDFINKLVFTDENIYLDYLNTEGNIQFLNSPNVKYLKGLRFPDDYVLQNNEGVIRLEGNKIYSGGIEANAVDCLGKINNIEVDKIVNLATPQHLQDMTFLDLTITESLNIEDNINGKKKDLFLANPLLSETSTIQSDVVVQDLKVHGNIFVENANELQEDLKQYLNR